MNSSERYFIEAILDQTRKDMGSYGTYFAVIERVKDIDSEGKVLVSATALNAFSFDEETWITCLLASHSRSRVHPKVGDAGIILFINNDFSLPVFLPLSLSGEQKEVQTKHILFSSPDKESSIVVDEEDGISLQSNSPANSSYGLQPMVLGDNLVTVLQDIYSNLDKLNEELKNIYQAISNHIHPTPTGPSGPSPNLAAPSSKGIANSSALQQSMTKEKGDLAKAGDGVISPTNKVN
jgi:hypothetical protein